MRNHNHEHDPAGHVPGINFAFQSVLGFQFGSAGVDRSVEPIQDLLPLVGTRYREPKQLGFAGARQVAFSSRSRHARRKTACLIFGHEALKHFTLCGPHRLISKTGKIRKVYRRIVRKRRLCIDRHLARGG